jgi:uncharacterized membrane protein
VTNESIPIIKRTIFIVLISMGAFVLGILLTDMVPLQYDDWQWRYGARVGLALLAMITSRVLAWRLPLRYRWVALIALLPLVFSIPYIRDLQGGVGRQYVATIPDESGEEAIQYEQLWLPYTDRVLK